ncbi:(2Fe-2S)-binding protein, partial [Achromobacter sp. GG226]|uniref:(2Fe-2S)-binding protein n=1 Tax=Verticiella alkaliphila TaxID=2779529 RepID=UPI001C0E0058
DGAPAPASVTALLAGRSAPAVRARIVCACRSVTDVAIQAGIDTGLDLDGLRRELGCGTGCGSCVPELRRRLAVATVAA